MAEPIGSFSPVQCAKAGSKGVLKQSPGSPPPGMVGSASKSLYIEKGLLMFLTCRVTCGSG